MLITNKTLKNQRPTAPPPQRLIDRADYRGKGDIAPLGVITLITLARPLIERIDQSAAIGCVMNELRPNYSIASPERPGVLNSRPSSGVSRSMWTNRTYPASPEILDIVRHIFPFMQDAHDGEVPLVISVDHAMVAASQFAIHARQAKSVAANAGKARSKIDLAAKFEAILLGLSFAPFGFGIGGNRFQISLGKRPKNDFKHSETGLR